MHDATSSTPLLTIAVPAFNESSCLGELWQELEAACRSHDWEYEVVFVDDGSTDATWSVIAGIARDHPEVDGIRLSRNFGHQQALLAGLAHARGAAVITMDADLQHPPTLVPEMVARWRAGAKVVATRRTDTGQATGAFKQLTARVFYRLFSALSGVKLEHGKADFRLLDREVVDHVLSLPESSLFLRGIVEWVGFPQQVLEYTAGDRAGGRSKYSLRRMIGLALTGITSFSVVPLRLILVVGLLTTTASLGYAAFAVVAAMSGAVVKGWTSIVCLFTFLFGVQFTMIGVMSEYLAQAFLEIKRRPRFIVAEALRVERSGREDDSGPA